MCSEYTVKIKPEAVEAALGAAVHNISGVKIWDKRVRISQLAPILYEQKEEIVLEEAVFPVQPFPNSRLSGLEHLPGVEDLELKRIYDRPTWKKGFEESPCLIPLTSFCEPVYWGEEKGKVVEFLPTKDDVLFVAGMRIKPRTPSTGKLNGFSMLTHTPTEQMLQYHHRMLVFLRATHAREWLENKDMAADERLRFLLDHRYLPSLEVIVDRQMAKAWEKRQAEHVHKLDAEKRYLDFLKDEGVAG